MYRYVQRSPATFERTCPSIPCPIFTQRLSCPYLPLTSSSPAASWGLSSRRLPGQTCSRCRFGYRTLRLFFRTPRSRAPPRESSCAKLSCAPAAGKRRRSKLAAVVICDPPFSHARDNEWGGHRFNGSSPRMRDSSPLACVVYCDKAIPGKHQHIGVFAGSSSSAPASRGFPSGLVGGAPYRSMRRTLGPAWERDGPFTLPAGLCAARGAMALPCPGRCDAMLVEPLAGMSLLRPWGRRAGVAPATDTSVSLNVAWSEPRGGFPTRGGGGLLRMLTASMTVRAPRTSTPSTK